MIPEDARAVFMLKDVEHFLRMRPERCDIAQADGGIDPLACLLYTSSALVPFVQEALEVETITFLSAPGDSARSGLRLQNSTRQTLPGGTLAVLGDGGLLGESALERLKPCLLYTSRCV